MNAFSVITCTLLNIAMEPKSAKYSIRFYGWRRGVVVTSLVSSPVITGMGDRVRVRLQEAAVYFGM